MKILESDTHLQKVTMMGCPCFAVSEDTLEDQLLHFINNDICGYSVAINAEKIQKYKSNQQLRQVIDTSIYPYPDGYYSILDNMMQISKRLFYRLSF
mgnify:CR=1 FL=1